MKSIHLCTAWILFTGLAIAEQNLTKAQAQKLASVILESPIHAKYRESFKLDQISYDKETDRWRFPSFGMGSMDVFEIRDDDGHYMIGTISNKSFGSPSLKFGIVPELRRKIRQLLAEFRTPK